MFRRQMNSNRLPTWVLLGYLILLWNLGPSVHRAHFFGLHAHSANGHSAHACGCCHSHDSSDESEDHVTADHDCALCDFFDQLQATSTSLALSPVATPVFAHRSVAHELSLATRISHAARGPPLA